ncbi:MAG TPA: fibronectin type III domain-containing protein [Pyrinomonadaceae bacterium]|nr:fibronectin type III domain-containing protein [Pyrinomonadaceae bacterium]
MATRHLSRLIIGMTIVVLTAALLFNGSSGSAAAGKGGPTLPGPGNLQVTNITETTVSLSWQGASSKSSFSYGVRITNLDNSAYNTVATVSQSQTTYTATFLAQNSNYRFAVYAVDSKGNKSADSNTASAHTLKDTTPPSTPVLQASVLNPSQVQLTWTKSTDNIPNNCCWFTFTMNGSSLTQNLNNAGAPVDKVSVIIRHIHPGTTNSFSVNVGDFSGNFASSNTVSATMPPSSDVTPPSAPTNVFLYDSIAPCELYLGWTQATDETDPQDKIEYEIYVNGALSPLPVSAGVFYDFVYAFQGDNTFTIKAVDRSGNSSAASSPFKLYIPGC